MDNSGCAGGWPHKVRKALQGFIVWEASSAEPAVLPVAQPCAALPSRARVRRLAAAARGWRHALAQLRLCSWQRAPVTHAVHAACCIMIMRRQPSQVPATFGAASALRATIITY